MKAEEPSSALPLSQSIAVVGAGIIGLSIALRLAESGWRVEVFDQAAIGSEASWAGAGMLAPGGEIESESPLAALALESRSIYRDYVHQLEHESGLAIDLQEAGALELAYSQEDLSALHRKALFQDRLGIRSRALSPTQVRTFWPRVRVDSLAGARFYADDGIVNPRDVVTSLQVVLRARGVQVHENCAVRSVAISREGAELTSAAKRRTFATVVISMGAWSSGLPVTGVPALPRAEPVKGHLIAYRQPEQTCSTIVRLGHTYLLQRANGLLLVGASVEKIGFDRTVQPSIVAELEYQASLVFPHLAETTPTETWIGFRPGAERLHLGPWHSPRLQLAYGHYRNGILLAPVTAQRIAAEINANWGMR